MMLKWLTKKLKGDTDLDDPWGLWELYGDTDDGVMVFGRYEGYASDAMSAAKDALTEWFHVNSKSRKIGYGIQPVDECVALPDKVAPDGD
jgi:hypothetical protein